MAGKLHPTCPQRVNYRSDLSSVSCPNENEMSILAGLIRRRFGASIPVHLNCGREPSRFLLNPSQGRTRLLSGEAESNRAEFPVENAYDILSVSESSSIAEIKASFRRLAKETHPDLIGAKKDSSTSLRFVQILAAYEVHGSFSE